jgi:soluble lytic murein transglycosylase
MPAGGWRSPAGALHTRSGLRGRTASGFLLLLLAVPLCQADAAPLQDPASESEAFSGIPWESLAELPDGLAAVRRAATIDSRQGRQEALAAIADDPARSDRARAAASYRLGTDALRRGRWTEAEKRLTAPELAESDLMADALHLLGRSLPGVRRQDGIALLRRVFEEFPDYGDRHRLRFDLGRRLAQAGAREEALVHLEAAITDGSFTLRGEALAAKAGALERLGRREEAARALEVLYYDMATHKESLPAGRTLSKLYKRPDVKTPSAAEKYPRAMRRAAGFARAGNHRKAHENYREVARRFASAGDPEFVRLQIGIQEFHRGRLSASLRTLAPIKREDLHPAALYYRGESLRRLERRTTQRRVLEELLALEQEHEFGERALYSLARSQLARNDRVAALPFLARLAEQFPNGQHGLFARWHVLWDRYRNDNLDGAAEEFERAARENPGAFMAGQFLYFAGRSRERTGDPDGAARLYREVFVGYQNSFYGRMATERLEEMGRADALANPLSEPRRLLERFRVRRTAEAGRIEDLYAAGYAERARDAALVAARRGLPDDPAFEAIRAWLLADASRNVQAIQALRRAAPFHTSSAGEALPDAWWRIFYPLRFEDRIQARAEQWDLDPYMVASLIRQESVFVPRTRSPVGARGLMQVMPATGRALARAEGVTFRASGLYDPGISIRFGTRYLRQLLDQFASRPELALAGYNAGPHRVRDWTDMNMAIPAEVFIEEIPFTETRNYVKLIMRNEKIYRRLYPELGEAKKTAGQ